MSSEFPEIGSGYDLHNCVCENLRILFQEEMMRPTICLPALRFVMEQQSWERLLFNWCVCLRVGFEEQEEVQSILAKPVGQKLVVRILQETSEHCIIQRVYDILLSATMYGTQIPKFPPHLNFIEKGRLKKNWHSRKKLTRSPCPNNHLIPPPPPHKLYLAVSQLLSIPDIWGDRWFHTPIYM